MPTAVAAEILQHADIPRHFTRMTASSLAESADDLTLVLEASTAAGSVALLRGERVLRQREVAMGVSREDSLFPALQAMLQDEDVSPAALNAIVCGSGPGSFTSLRIAAAVAKGLAHASNVPLYGVPSLLLAAASCDTPGRYIVHSDALRGERYALPVTIDADLSVRADAVMSRVASEEIEVLADDRRQLVVPGGAGNANAFDGATIVIPDAARLTRVHGWRQLGAVSLESWEPAYGRLAEAQVKWEAAHQRPLPAG